MGSFFNPFSPFFQGVRKVYQFIGLSLLWLICSLPIFTMGAATTALYYTVTKVMKQSEGYILKEFFSSFVKNFKQATIMWLIYLIVGFALSFNIKVIYITDKADMKLLLIPMIALSVMLVVNAIYYLTLLGRFENTSLGLLKSAVILSIVHLPTTLLVILIVAGLSILAYIWKPFMFIIVPSIGILLSINLEKVFIKYMSEDKGVHIENCINTNRAK